MREFFEDRENRKVALALTVLLLALGAVSAAVFLAQRRGEDGSRRALSEEEKRLLLEGGRSTSTSELDFDEKRSVLEGGRSAAQEELSLEEKMRALAPPPTGSAE